MATPEIFQGLEPTVTVGGFTPLQLALADQLTKGTSPPLGVNNDFLVQLQRFADSGVITPEQAGDFVGIAFVAQNDSIYLFRNAQDCGPNETGRTERVYIGEKSQLTFATGSFMFYGQHVQSGTGVNGSGGGSGNE